MRSASDSWPVALDRVSAMRARTARQRGMQVLRSGRASSRTAIHTQIMLSSIAHPSLSVPVLARQGQAATAVVRFGEQALVQPGGPVAEAVGDRGEIDQV